MLAFAFKYVFNGDLLYKLLHISRDFVYIYIQVDYFLKFLYFIDLRAAIELLFVFIVLFINLLTPWLKKPEGSMPHSQGLSNNSYPEPNQPNSPH